MKYLVANWKSNKTIPEATLWLHQSSIISHQSPKNLEIIIAPPFTALPSLKKVSSPFKFATQNLSPFPSGPYTGEISAEMLKDLVDYAIIGHSERRRYFQESNETVAKKVKQALKFKITPIVCLDEPYIETQIKAINYQSLIINHQLIFAYEPLSAIGSGKPDTPESANRVAEKIKKMANQTPVLYGGSASPENAKSFIVEKNIDGLLIGNASLNPGEFVEIIQAVRLIEQ